MCGIAGWIGAPAPGRDAPALQRMLDTLVHRGPDGEGVFTTRTKRGDEVWLGHRRLAIIDPAGAAQPMRDTLGSLSLVFNGEIYNFRELRRQLASFGYSFRLDSDTEVLLRAYQHWGEKVVHKLQGMFAFAIWDEVRQRLFLARDRFGEKPLFYHCGPNGLSFASEIKALRTLPECRQGSDLAAVRDYLEWRYVPAPRTLYAGIFKLMPGSAAVWDGLSLHQWRYWQAPDRAAFRDRLQPGEIVSTFLGKLDAAVNSQMVSDVPFGAFLSGGLDSSMIVGLMSRHCPQVRTFSAGFAGSSASELPFAARVAQEFSTRHREIIVEPRDVTEMLPSLIHFRDAPVSEPSDVAIHRMAQVAAGEVKMVLTGEGADEILGGYPKHLYERLSPAFRQIPASLREGLILPLIHALPYRFRRAKTAATSLCIEDWAQRSSSWFGALSPAMADQLSRLPRHRGAVAGPPFDADSSASSLRRQLYFDQSSWLPDNLLERGDRMTMAASLESRVPFLDYNLVNFVSGLPDHYRVRGMQTKWLLREASRQVLPAEIRQRPKVGFRVPVEQWFRGPLRDYLREHLASSTSLTRAYYHAPVLDGMLAEHLTGRQNHEKLLWTLLNLEIWQRQHAAT